MSKLSKFEIIDNTVVCMCQKWCFCLLVWFFRASLNLSIPNWLHFTKFKSPFRFFCFLFRCVRFADACYVGQKLCALKAQCKLDRSVSSGYICQCPPHHTGDGLSASTGCTGQYTTINVLKVLFYC